MIRVCVKKLDEGICVMRWVVMVLVLFTVRLIDQKGVWEGDGKRCTSKPMHIATIGKQEEPVDMLCHGQ